MPSEATEYEDSRAMFSAASAIQLEKVLDIADVWCVHAAIFSFLPLPGRGAKCCDERVCTSVCPLGYNNEYRPSPTKPRERLHHTANVLQTKADAPYDKRATELSTVESAYDGRFFRPTASDLSKVASFNLLHLQSVPPLGVTPFEFCRDL